MQYVDLIKSLADFGFSTIFIAGVLFFLYKYIDRRFFTTEQAQEQAKIMREYNQELDDQKNARSKERLKTLQKYLEENQEKLHDRGVDRVSVWINHNGVRNGNIHFIFYSIVAEITGRGLSRTSDSPTGNQRLPYYVFSDFEEMVEKEGREVFIPDTSTLTGAGKNITKDLGTQSVTVVPIYNLKRGIDGLIFFSAVFQKQFEKPELRNMINDIRALFI